MSAPPASEKEKKKEKNQPLTLDVWGVTTNLFRDAHISLMIAVVGPLCLTQPQGMPSGKCFKGEHAATLETVSTLQ